MSFHFVVVVVGLKMSVFCQKVERKCLNMHIVWKVQGVRSKE